MMDVLDLIEKYSGIFLSAVFGSGVGAYISSYLKKKGENLATHEDIDKLVDQVAAVTTVTKQIEANVSRTAWRRERRAELQLELIDSLNTLTSQYLQNFIADPGHVPNLEWFTSFSATDAAVKALFHRDTYAEFKKLEILIGPGMGEPGEPLHPLVASERFVQARDAALKAMYDTVIDTEENP